MIRRVVWFSLGAGAGVYALIKARRYAAKANPQALVVIAGARAKGSAAALTQGARDFTERVRAGMAEREAELRDAVGLPPTSD